MKIGDKILVTYSNGDQFAGRIFGETAKSWKVEFDNGDQRTIRKTMTMEVLPENDVPETEEKVEETPVVEEPVEETPVVEEPVEETKPYEPTVYTPSKKIKRGNVLILIGILVVMAVVGALVLFGTGII